MVRKIDSQKFINDLEPTPYVEVTEPKNGPTTEEQISSLENTIEGLKKLLGSCSKEDKTTKEALKEEIKNSKKTLASLKKKLKPVENKEENNITNEPEKQEPKEVWTAEKQRRLEELEERKEKAEQRILEIDALLKKLRGEDEKPAEVD